MQQVTDCLSLQTRSRSQLHQQRGERRGGSPCMQMVFGDNFLTAAMLSTHRIQHQHSKYGKLSASISKSGINVAQLATPAPKRGVLAVC